MKTVRHIFCLVTALLISGALFCPVSAKGVSSPQTSFLDENGLINEQVYRQYCIDNHVDINVDDVIFANNYLVQQQTLNPEIYDTYGAVTDSLTKLDIAGYFAAEDGISNSHISAIKNQSELAYTKSILLYDGAERDTYRHFYWSFQSTKQTSNLSTKVFMTNYEYASKLQSNYRSYFKSAMDNWTVLDPENASALSNAEALAKVLTDRDNAVATIKSYSNFISYFADDAIQDFHNNRQGRTVSFSYTYVDDAYNALKDSLVIGEKLTDLQRKNVYNAGDWKV